MSKKFDSTAPLKPAFADPLRFRVQIRTYRNGVRLRVSNQDDAQRKLVELALNEAEALAWQTPFPQLVFPTLAEEKATALANWRARQDALRRRESERSLAV